MDKAMSKVAFILVVASLLSSARGQTWTGPSQLQPVHGLYVKPSSDGTTGDLYVAASEDSGNKAQWLTDQPVNFLPASETIPLAPTYPAHDESYAQKRAVINSPSTPLQYSYAAPLSPIEGAQLPYSYSNPETSSTQCEKTAPVSATAMTYNPFRYVYPQLMQAYAKAQNVLKEAGMSDGKAGSVVTHASPFWTNYSYPQYPMYVMVDPSAWTPSQPQPAQATANAETTESLLK